MDKFFGKISPFSVILIMTILTIIGIALIPRVDVRYTPSPRQGSTLSISFSWDGASPRVIEQEVTSRIEGVVSAVSGVESVNSTSGYGYGSVLLKLKKGVNVSSVRFEISSILKQVASKLPEGVSYPTLYGGNVSTGRNATKELLSYRINANMRKDQIKDYAERNIKPIIEQIDEVQEVNISGEEPQILEITYNPLELANYGLNVGDITNGISNFLGKSNIVGDVEQVDDRGNKNRITVRLESRYDDSDLNTIPIIKVQDKVIFLGSLVEMTYKDRPAQQYFRINGLNNSTITINIDSKASLIGMSEIVRAKMKEIESNLVDGFHLELIYDSAKEIKKEVNKLVSRTLLSLLVLMLFVWVVSRSWRYLLIIAVTLISNVLISVILYYLFDVELHVLSLAGIAVSFGIIIDNTIVMVDHYSYYRNRKVFIAILAALLTTIGSLVVIFFMPEYVQNDLNDFSAIVIINLSVSLLVSLLFVPAIIDKYKYSSKENKRAIKSRRKVVKFSNIYYKYIRFTQRRKWIYIVIFILAFGMPINKLPSQIGQKQWWSQEDVEQKWYHDLYNKTIGSAFYQQTLKKPLEYILGGSFRLFTMGESSGYRVNQEREVELTIRGAMPEGGTAEEMNVKIKPLEVLLSKYSEIERYTVNINQGNANVVVKFKEEHRNTSFPYMLESEVVSTLLSIGGADWSTHGVSERGFSNALNLTHKSHRISISGYNYSKLFLIAEDLVGDMRKNRRVTDIEIQASSNNYWGYGNQKSLTEMYVKYDPQMVAVYKFNPSQGYSTLSSMLSSTNGGTYRGNGVETDISLVSSQRNVFDAWKFLNSYVDVGGVGMRYSNLAEIGVRKARSEINKENQEYSISVAFNYLGSYELSSKFIEETTNQLNQTLPIGFTTDNKSEGWYRDTGEQYWLILLIIAIIFFVCSILFESILQPLVIIALIPISYIGTFLTFSLSGISFGAGGFASLVLLSGLVVNAAIYIINEYNNTLKISNGSKISSYIRAYNHKIIPVFLTIISTVLGLSPFLIDGVKEVFWFSFAIGTIGGLLFSIIAIIFFMPILMPLKKRIKN